MNTPTPNLQMIKFFAFLRACGLDTYGMNTSIGDTAGGRTIMNAQVGEQSKTFKRAILKSGWQQIESLSLGEGERELSFTHPDIEGGISLHEFKRDGRWNKIYLSN